MTVVNDGQRSTEAGLLISYYIVLSFWAAQGLGMSMLTRNVAGQTKKSFAVTMNFVCWSAGNAIGESRLEFIGVRSNKGDLTEAQGLRSSSTTTRLATSLLSLHTWGVTFCSRS